MNNLQDFTETFFILETKMILLKYFYIAEVTLCRFQAIDFSVYLDKMIKGMKEDI